MRRHISPIPVYYLPRLRAKNVYWFKERKRFQAGKGKKQKIPCTNNYRCGLYWWHSALANTPPQAKTLLHSLEFAAGGIGLHFNANKMEYMCFNQRGNISTLKGGPLKLVDKFTYQGSCVSLTKKDINMWLAKAWTAVDRLSVIWKSDPTDRIKRSFFQAAVMSVLLYGCPTWTLTKCMEKKLDSNHTRMLWARLNKSWRPHPTKRQLYGHLPPITKTIQVRWTRHCWRSKEKAGWPAGTYI